MASPASLPPSRPDDPQFSIGVVGEDDRRVVTVHGQLFEPGGQILQALGAQFVREQARRVRVELRHLSAADVDGVRAISALRTLLQAAGVTLAISIASPAVLQTFQAFTDVVLGGLPRAQAPFRAAG